MVKRNFSRSCCSQALFSADSTSNEKQQALGSFVTHQCKRRLHEPRPSLVNKNVFLFVPTKLQKC
uniref:Uncharacterized protein n=1 Tax=Zea mays TaxID=4577 RepID=C4J052_MAIZE|nr:unknown [Zea mays]